MQTAAQSPKGEKDTMVTKSNSFIEGLMPYQVFPRSGKSGSIPFAANVSGAMVAEVVRNADGSIAARQEWDLSGESASAQRSLSIDGVPVGGEYTIRFAAGARVQTFEHILVGEIWILGGQSNSVGVQHAPDPPDPAVHFFREGKWQEGIEPIFPMINDSRPYVSAWRRAAQAYYQQTGIPIGMMGWAYGGVPMSRFWDAEIKDMPDFRDLVSDHGPGATVYLWYQGESDANPKCLPVYKDRLTTMAACIRRYAANPDLIMMVVQLSYVIEEPGKESPYVGRLREAQRQFCAEDPRSVLIPALPYSHGDIVHLDYDGYGALGRRIGDCLAEIHKTGAIRWQGPRAVSAQFTDATRKRIQVTFDSAEELHLLDKPPGATHVSPPRDPAADWLITDSQHQGYTEIKRSVLRAGRLTVEVNGGSLDSSAARYSGQSVEIPLLGAGYIRPTSIQAEGLSLVLDLPVAAEAGAAVSYGLMSNSLCSLVDERGRPAATFADMAVVEASPDAP